MGVLSSGRVGVGVAALDESGADSAKARHKMSRALRKRRVAETFLTFFILVVRS
jgi:hypothetical protein